MACYIYLPALLTTKKFSYEQRLIEFWIFFIVIAIPHMIVYLQGCLSIKQWDLYRVKKKLAIPHPASKTTGKQIQACMRN